MRQQNTILKTINQIDYRAKCRESFTATLVIIIMLGFLAWLNIYA
jgi:hypothetical protein